MLWKMYPKALYQPLCKLLEKFEIWVKLKSGDYLVPCLLSDQAPENVFDKVRSRGARMLGRVYVIPFCPHGFFSHLLLRRDLTFDFSTPLRRQRQSFFRYRA